MTLKNKVAIITGAGRGIGKEIALAYSKKGANLVLVSRTPLELENTVKEIFQLGGNCISIKTDISNKTDVEAMVNQTLNKFGTLDVLVNNAGIQGPIGPLPENTIDEWIRTVEVNLIGTFLCTKSVLPTMVKKKCGKIICISGGGATSARPFFSAYASSKAAVIRLVETLAEEVREYNIQVNAIAPGPVITKMWDEMVRCKNKMHIDEAKHMEKQRSIGGVSAHYATELAVFFASQASEHITGRLISALHDNWQQMNALHPDIYKLRRIDTYTLKKLNPNWEIE